MIDGMSNRYQITLKMMLAAIFWLCVGLAGIAGTANLRESKGGHPSHSYEILRTAIVLGGLLFSGAAFGAAIEAVTGLRRHLPIIGVVLCPAILLVGSWLWAMVFIR